MKYASLVLLSFIAGCGVNSAQTSGHAQPGQVEAGRTESAREQEAAKQAGRRSTPDGDDVICTNEAPQGSIVRKRVCTTAKEREANRRRAEFEAEASATR